MAISGAMATHNSQLAKVMKVFTDLIRSPFPQGFQLHILEKQDRVIDSSRITKAFSLSRHLFFSASQWRVGVKVFNKVRCLNEIATRRQLFGVQNRCLSFFVCQA